MTGKRKQQKDIQKHKSYFEHCIFLFLCEQHKNTCKGHCRITGNSPLDHILSDQTSKIFFVINFVIKQRYIIFCSEPVCSKHRNDHRKKDHRSDHHCNHRVYRKNPQPLSDILKAPVCKQVKISKCRIENHKNPQHIKEIKIRKACQGNGPDECIRLFFFVNLINPQKNQRQIDHRIGEIRMLHCSVDRPARKNVNHRSHKGSLF